MRHSRSCSVDNEGRGCDCSPSYEASVWLSRERVKVRKTFHRLGDAKAWRTDAMKAAKDGKLPRPTAKTVQEAAEEWADEGEGRGSVDPVGCPLQAGR